MRCEAPSALSTRHLGSARANWRGSLLPPAHPPKQSPEKKYIRKEVVVAIDRRYTTALLLLLLTCVVVASTLIDRCCYSHRSLLLLLSITAANFVDQCAAGQMYHQVHIPGDSMELLVGVDVGLQLALILRQKRQ